MIKKAAMIAIAIIMGAVGLEAQNIVEAKVDQYHTVRVPANTPTVVASVSVNAGLWLVSGHINAFESAELGTVFVWGGLAVDEIEIPVDGTEVVNSADLTRVHNVIMPLTFSSQLLRVGVDPHIYLVAYSYQPSGPAPVCYAWGRITAECIAGACRNR